MPAHEHANFVNAKPVRIGATVITETGLAALSTELACILVHIPLDERGQDNEIVIELKAVQRVRFRNHFLVQLLARPDANHFMAAIRSDGERHIGNPVTWKFGDEDFTAPHLVERSEYELNSLIERDVEAGHSLVGER